MRKQSLSLSFSPDSEQLAGTHRHAVAIAIDQLEIAHTQHVRGLAIIFDSLRVSHYLLYSTSRKELLSRINGLQRTRNPSSLVLTQSTCTNKTLTKAVLC